MHQINFSLPARAPFRLDLTVWALKRRDRNIVDFWDGNVYVRVLVLDHRPVKVEVKQNDKEPRIYVTAKSRHPLSKHKAEISSILNNMLGLKKDLKKFYTKMQKEEAISPLAMGFIGVKPPRFPTLFEALVNAVAFQQLSLEAGFSLLNKLTERRGKSFKEKSSIYFAFPEPQDIKKCTKRELLSFGFSHHKAATVLLLASTFLKEKKEFSHLEELSNEEIVEFLCELKGIGRWSAEYVLLRGFGRTEVLPGDDVGIHKSLKRLLKLRKDADYSKVKQMEKKWHPFAGIIYFHVLLEKLSQKKVLKD